MPKNGLNTGKIIFGEMAGKSFLKKFKKISKNPLTFSPKDDIIYESLRDKKTP